VPESREELYPDAPVESRECKVDGVLGAAEKRELKALRRRPPGPTASLSLSTSSAVLSLLWPLDVCAPGRSGGAVIRLLVRRRPARLPNRRANPPVRGSANGEGGTSDVVKGLLGPGPALLSFETWGCCICEGKFELGGAVAALRIESASMLARGAALGGSGRGNVRSSTVRARVGVVCSTGLRGVGVCWLCVCGTGGIARTGGTGLCCGGCCCGGCCCCC